MQPKVFISHATEDKERFVMDFAKRLRQQHGVDAWMDKWEMLPGDSLVDKIFEEGLKDASTVVVVLSRNSVDKPWVREELNAAVVKRLNTGSKLIPVVIDDCAVPEVLKSTLWERIDDLNSYQSSMDRIVAAIYGVNDKPPPGSSPSYIQSVVENIAGLNNLDSLVLKLACDQAVAQGSDFMDPHVVYCKEDGEYVIPEMELRDSMEMLEQQYYISISHTLGDNLDSFFITIAGFDVYAQSYVPNYQGILSDVVSALVNKQLSNNDSIAQELQQPRLVVDHILDLLEHNGHLKQSKLNGGRQEVFRISPSLRRSLQN